MMVNLDVALIHFSIYYVLAYMLQL